VTPSPGARMDLPGDLARRGTITTSACGVCGRRSIEDLLARAKPVPEGRTVTREAISRAVAMLRESQPLFSRTGGCHGAILVSFDGARVASFEDVGRHNAVDKLVGSMLLAGAVPLADRILVVSGRTSFEIVQKAALAGISIVAGVSAPSSLAVDLATRMNVTLAGFVRPGGFNLYSGERRVSP